eukprot:scaffold5613_cov133-Isochrysis_galbana.AAC.4
MFCSCAVGQFGVALGLQLLQARPGMVSGEVHPEQHERCWWGGRCNGRCKQAGKVNSSADWWGTWTRVAPGWRR